MGLRVSMFQRPTLAALLTLAYIPHASATDTLNALSQCPKHGPNRACLLVSVLPPDDPYANCHYTGPYPDKTFRVRGSLNNASARQYRLKVENPDRSSSAPEQAFLGQSPSGRVIVLTNQGPFEILDRRFDAGASKIYVVDKRRWKVRTRIIAHRSYPTVTSATDIGIWDEERKTCISAPIEPGQRLRVIDHGCAARLREPTDLDRARDVQERMQSEIRSAARVFAEWYASKAPGYAQPPPPEPQDWVDTPTPNEFAWLGNVEREFVTLKQVRRLLPREVNDDMGNDTDIASHFGGSGTGIRVLKIKGSDTLIISVSYDGGGC